MIKSDLLQGFIGGVGVGVRIFFNRGILRAISSKFNFLFHAGISKSRNKARKIHSYSLYNYSSWFMEGQNDGFNVSFLHFS